MQQAVSLFVIKLWGENNFDKQLQYHSMHTYVLYIFFILNAFVIYFD